MVLYRRWQSVWDPEKGSGWSVHWGCFACDWSDWAHRAEHRRHHVQIDSRDIQGLVAWSDTGTERAFCTACDWLPPPPPPHACGWQELLDLVLERAQ